ncbi:hypothetical protein [Photorhabdus laumondii]|uniref:hypothetical protein n=1 Tax=Photorhabdus laumondii TaxID=2218628 RepID=UPI000DF5C91E|nr:hypothetical protein [Photorhabdus laumondii]AXG42432.1 hypothetical protein PluDJC_09295 [Photorhabdus laumondii subsp. laumondii]
MINLIQRYWLIVVWGSLCIWLGDRWAESRLQPQINQEIENRQEAELSFYRAQKATAELNAGALHDLIEKQQAQQHANEKMSNDLYAAITRLSQATQRIEQSIPDALSRDGVLTPALALTGCGSTKPRSVTTTPPLVISACPAIPPDLLQLPLKPPMPRSGEPQALLTHASRYGQWSQELEQKLLAIKALVDKQRGKQNEQTD